MTTFETVILIAFILLSIIVTGCSSTVTVTEKVYIPTKCQATFPVKKSESFYGDRYTQNQDPTQSYLDYIKNKLIYNQTYILELETTLDFCINGTTELEQE